MKTFDIFEKSDKRRLYWLIDLYLSDQINTDTFCDEYYDTYGLGDINRDLFDQQESKAFFELKTIVYRCSSFAEDHIKYPGMYYTPAQLKQKILEVKETLAEQYEKAMTEAFIITSINAG